MYKYDQSCVKNIVNVTGDYFNIRDLKTINKIIKNNENISKCCKILIKFPIDKYNKSAINLQ